MNRTSRVTLNPAFLQEIKEDHRTFYRLLAAARHHLGRRGGYWRDHTPRAMVDLLERVRDRLAMHFALEEAYGYFEDPVWTEPQISIPAQRLREQHRELYAELLWLTERAIQVRYHETPRSRVPQICADFERFCRHFEEHERRESELMVQALYEDVGVGD
ncbi:MAG: hemerythrin domain-containing protein [Pirellulales bacterium]